MSRQGQAIKPRLGLRPRCFADVARIGEILLAVWNYTEAGCPVPVEWLGELVELMGRNRWAECHLRQPAESEAGPVGGLSK